MYLAAGGLSFDQAHRVLDDPAQVAGGADWFTLARVIEQHPHDPGNSIDLLDNDFEPSSSLGEAVRLCSTVLGSCANDAHRGADLVGKPRGKRADGGEAVGVLQPAFEFEFAPMPLEQVGAGPGQLLVEAAKLLGQQFDFVAGGAAFRVVLIRQAGDAAR